MVAEKCQEQSKGCMGAILICRHGSTDYNLGEQGERVRGWDPVRLNSAGRWEAFDLANRIARKYRIGQIYSSDLPRAAETSEFIASRVKSPIAPSVDLRTQNMGYLTGCAVKDVLTDLVFYDANPDECPKDGESRNHFLDRYFRDLDDLMRETRKSKFDAVLTTHGRNVSVTPSLLSGAAQVPYHQLPHTGALMEIQPHGKSWKLVVFHKSLRNLSPKLEFSRF